MLRLTQKLVSKSINKNAFAATRFVVSKPVFVSQQRFQSNTVQPSDEQPGYDYSDYPMYENEGGLGDEYNDEHYPEWLRNWQGWQDEFYTDQQQQKAIETPETPTKEIQVEKEKEKNFELFVGNDRDDMRLDRFISTILRDKYMKRKDVKYTIPNHSLLEKLARKKKILVNGKPVKKLGDRVYAKDKVSLPLSAVLAQQTETHVPKEKKTIEMTQDQIYEVKSWVIFKNAEIIVINKPYGIAVQGGTGQSTHIDGMLRALRFEYEEDPKLVHRLDKDTSGVLVLARNREGAHRMAEWFQDRKLGLKKMYWAIVAGKPKPATGRIKMAMEKVRVAGGEKVFARDELEGDAKLSVTEYRTLDHAGEYISWLAMYPITGRLHQLRVHCSTALKCDIIGDYKYGVGCPDSLKSLVQDKGRVKMHLHARAMMLPYLNENGKRIVIKAPVPQHMAETMESFGFEESAGDKVAFKAK